LLRSRVIQMASTDSTVLYKKTIPVHLHRDDVLGKKVELVLLIATPGNQSAQSPIQSFPSEPRSAHYSSASKSNSITMQLTDESDPYFLYTVHIGMIFLL
jgi:hypothetical protein